MNHAERAAYLFKEKKFNCAQAVFGAFTDVTGVDEAMAIRMSGAFGGGMGRLREVCGAVSGAIMVLSMVYAPEDPAAQDAKMEFYRRIQEFAGRFREMHGDIVCRELLGEKAGAAGHVPAERTEEYYKMRPCERFVYDAADILEKYLEELKNA